MNIRRHNNLDTVNITFILNKLFFFVEWQTLLSGATRARTGESTGVPPMVRSAILPKRQPTLVFLEQVAPPPGHYSSLVKRTSSESMQRLSSNGDILFTSKKTWLFFFCESFVIRTGWLEDTIKVRGQLWIILLKAQ